VLVGALLAAIMLIGPTAENAGGAPWAMEPRSPGALQSGVSPEVLMQADRDFAAEVAEGGAAAWASWFAEDGAIIQPQVGEVRGRSAIRDFMAALDDPNVSLSWEPDRADIAASGDLGWTTGHYVSEVRGPDGALQRSEGLYVSIWRRQADGSWKVVMDLGNPTSPPPGR
jgi:ketosteroid isomerase-like protein